MNYITFLSLTCKNIGSVGNMPITIDLARSPTTVVLGSNGVGKSTLLLDAICFGLYGTPFRNITKSQLINNKNNHWLLVEVQFKRGEDHILVRRGHKPAVFEIIVNGKLVDQEAHTRDYQEMLEKTYLGIDFTTFTQMVIVGRANYTPFLSLPAGKKREFVESVLDLSIFANMLALTKDDIKQHTAKLNRAETQISGIKAAIASQEKLINSLEVAERESEESRIADVQRRITEYNDELAHHERSLNAITVLDEGVVDKLLNAVKGLNSEIKKREAAIQNLSFKYQDNSEQVEFLENNSTCSQCQQPINERFRVNSITQLKEVCEKMASLSKRLEEDRTKLEEQQSKMRQILIENDEKARNIIELNKHMARFRASISSLEKDLVPRRLQEDKISDEKVILEDQLSQLETAEQAFNELSSLTPYYKMLELCLKDTGIKASIISEFVGTLNHLVNSNIKQLGLFANVKIDQVFDEEIKMRGFEPMSYNQLSEGEKLRLDMAVMMAWRDVARYKSNMSCNLLIMDEIFDSSVDSEGANAFAELLKSTPDLNVFVITHTPEKLADSFRSFIKLEKVDGFTQISVGDY